MKELDYELGLAVDTKNKTISINGVNMSFAFINLLTEPSGKVRYWREDIAGISTMRCETLPEGIKP